MACKTSKTNIAFTTVMVVPIPKYIYGQYLYEQANAGTTMWKLRRAGLQK